MPLIHSPLSDSVLAQPPRKLIPRSAFLMRQIGEPPDIDRMMSISAREVLAEREFLSVDAETSTGGKDFLERIFGLIRATGFTIAIFSGDTRPASLANIMLELGFAATCGKLLTILKSKGVAAPSDLTRTDWIEFDPADIESFKQRIRHALDEIDSLATYERTLLDIALEAPAMDCAVAFERATKSFLLTGDTALLDKAEHILERLKASAPESGIADLQRLRDEVAMFVRQGRQCAATPSPPPFVT